LPGNPRATLRHDQMAFIYVLFTLNEKSRYSILRKNNSLDVAIFNRSI